MKGKSIVAKRNFCNSSRYNSLDQISWLLIIKEYGKVENTATGFQCTFLGEDFNPLTEVDKFGKINPFQDPNRGTLPGFISRQRNLSGAFPTCVANSNASGYEDLEPFTLLQNLDGIESIMGRSVLMRDPANNNFDKSCCIIARAKAPDGFGPKPVPFPLTTMSNTYNSYGMNYAVPLPYHKHGYQATGDVDTMAGNSNFGGSLVDQYLS